MIIREINHQDTWSIRHEVMWPDKPLDYIKLADDEKGNHFGLYIEGKIVSVISVFINEKSAQFRKFATLHEFQNRGLGSVLLKHVIKFLTDMNIDILWCNARRDKIDFYKKFALDETNDTFVKSGIEYVIMKKHLS